MKTRSGFTLIEVMLFIGISSFLIVGLMVGTSVTVARQRYNDSVQDLAEFFRRQYSAVINPENIRDPSSTINDTICSGTSADSYRGRSNCLLYGRLIVIGEVSDPTIYAYDVIGSKLDDADILLNSRNLVQALGRANINTVACDEPTNTFKPVGQYQYNPQWSARLEKTGLEKTTTTDSNSARTSILIIRSPLNGFVHTLKLDNVAIPIQNYINPPSSCGSNPANTLLTLYLPTSSNPNPSLVFEAADINLCVGSEDIFAPSGHRRNIRIARDGHNASAVKLVDLDDIYDPNDSTTNPEGNQCQ